MRTYRFDALTGLDDLHQHEEPVAEPQRGEILLRIQAVSLNYRDIAMPLGRYPSPAKPGLIPTSDAAAEVMEVGEGVTQFRPGDRVIGAFHPRWFGGERPRSFAADSYGSAQDGWLSEYKVVSQEAVVPLPDGLSWEEGSTLPCAAATAWCALAGGTPIRAGQTVLTLGTGGVSIFAVQLAKAVGARVIATTSSADKAERLVALGADEVLNYRELPDWGDAVRELTGGRGVERIVEVGGSSTIGQSLKAVAVDGEVVLVGFLGSEPANIDYFDIQGTYARLRSISVGDRGNLVEAVRAIGESGIRPVIDAVYPFEDAAAAFQHLASGEHVGKVVVRIAAGGS